MAIWIDWLLKMVQGNANPQKTHLTPALPLKPEPSRTIEDARKLAGQLIEQVLDDELDCERALKRWPWKDGENTPEAERDESLQVAYQALWYFYADELAINQEAFYLDVQLHLLRQMALHLKAAEALPFDLLMGYKVTPHTEKAFYVKATKAKAPRFFSGYRKRHWFSLTEWKEAIEEAFYDWKQLWHNSLQLVPHSSLATWQSQLSVIKQTSFTPIAQSITNMPFITDNLVTHHKPSFQAIATLSTPPELLGKPLPLSSIAKPAEGFVFSQPPTAVNFKPQQNHFLKPSRSRNIKEKPSQTKSVQGFHPIEFN